MKKIIVLFLLLNFSFVNCQTICDEFFCHTFQDTMCLSRISIDTAYPQNIWQIGKPHKVFIDTAAGNSRVIITDTVNPYKINNHSVFIIKKTATNGDIYGFKMFQGEYYSETDSLKDYGKIEFSPDNGTTWIDLINDTTYSASIIWYSPIPVLTGRSFHRRYFDAVLADIHSVFNVQFGDTLLYRFTFISDSIYDNLNGLLFDNICFADFVEGISETLFKPVKSKIFPNPSSDVFTIEFENPASDMFNLAVYDIHSKMILSDNNISGNKTVINLQKFRPGIYVYKLTNLKAQKRCWGKLFKEK